MPGSDLPPLTGRDASVTEAIETDDETDLTAHERLELWRWTMACPVIAPPPAEEWRDMIGTLRFFMARQRDGLLDPGLSDQQALCRGFVNVLAQFFLAMPGTKAEGLHQPLALLVTAFNDLAKGKVPDIFKPVRKPRGRARDQQIDDIVKGKAARLMALLIQEGRPRREAASLVANTLKSNQVRGAGKVTPAKIENWLERCQGHSAMSDVTLAHFRASLPPEAGTSAASQADYLIRELRHSPIIRAALSQQVPT